MISACTVSLVRLLMSLALSLESFKQRVNGSFRRGCLGHLFFFVHDNVSGEEIVQNIGCCQLFAFILTLVSLLCLCSFFLPAGILFLKQ